MLYENYEMSGRFNLVVRSSDGYIKRQTGFFDNIITNYGLNRIAVGPVFNGCTVGTGNTPESASDVTIQNYVARTATTAPGGSATPFSGGGDEPYHAGASVTYRFPQGSATGNLTEVGIIALYSESDNYPLWSRTLIKDESGNPVTLTVLPDEILDVVYEARIYPQQNYTSGSVILNSDSYDYRVGMSFQNGSKNGYAFLFGLFRQGQESSYTRTTYSGPLSAAPNYAATGSATSSGTGGILGVYNPGSFSRSIKFTIPPGSATGLIRSIAFELSPFSPSYSLEFTPAFNKTAPLELSVTLIVAWGRR